jgi:hypothetical protein
MVGACAGAGALAAQCRAEIAEIESQIALLADSACVEATRGSASSCASSKAAAPRLRLLRRGDRVHLGIATERGWTAHTTELPRHLSEGSQRDSFIRGAVAGCKPVELSETHPGTLGRALRAR